MQEIPHGDTRRPSACSCNSLFSHPSPPLADNPSSGSSSLSPSSPLSSSCSSVSSHGPGSIFSDFSYSGNNFPFSSHLSAKVCLKAALNIAQSFETLPYPNPTGTDCLPPTYLSPNSCVEVPRTMPAFACCAMQSSYAMLMLCHKTRIMNCNDFTDKQNDSLVSNLLGQLRHGLQMVLGALKNYSVAFEALDGMRGKSSST